jgi:MFS transporter, DHA2 family, multidrug resistance protein
MAKALIERREQFHTGRVGEFLDRFNSAMDSFFQQSQALSFQQTGDADASRQMALQALADPRQKQAVSLANFDDFLLFAVIPVVLVLLVPLMKRSVAERGTHIGAEQTRQNGRTGQFGCQALHLAGLLSSWVALAPDGLRIKEL